MKWEIEYYNQKVYDEIIDWPKKLLSKYLRVSDLLEQYGPNLGLPFSRTLKNGLFELRIKSDTGISRAFYCFCDNRRIIILSTYIKKSEKIPQRILKNVKKRLKEVKNG